MILEKLIYYKKWIRKTIINKLIRLILKVNNKKVLKFVPRHLWIVIFIKIIKNVKY